MKVLVTGSNGFIGKHLIAELSYQNIEYLEVDNSIDLCQPNCLDSIGPVDIVYHLAAKTYIPDSFNNPLKFFENNFQSTLNVLEYCKKFNARIIMPSTYLYGNPEYLPIDESHPISPSSPYSTSKLISESLIQSYSKDFGVEGIILRLFNVYGSHSNPNFLIPKIIYQAINKKSVELFDPRPKRDFVYVSDVVDALIKSAFLKEIKLEIFNIGYGKSYSINDILSIVQSNLSDPFIVNFSGEIRKNEVMETVADISKSKKTLKWKPKIDLEQGIKLIILNDYKRKD